jgi:hypothetical protein
MSSTTALTPATISPKLILDASKRVVAAATSAPSSLAGQGGAL